MARTGRYAVYADGDAQEEILQKMIKPLAARTAALMRMGIWNFGVRGNFVNSDKLLIANDPQSFVAKPEVWEFYLPQGWESMKMM